MITLGIKDHVMCTKYWNEGKIDASQYRQCVATVAAGQIFAAKVMQCAARPNSFVKCPIKEWGAHCRARISGCKTPFEARIGCDPRAALCSPLEICRLSRKPGWSECVRNSPLESYGKLRCWEWAKDCDGSIYVRPSGYAGNLMPNCNLPPGFQVRCGLTNALSQCRKPIGGSYGGIMNCKGFPYYKPPCSGGPWGGCMGLWRANPGLCKYGAPMLPECTPYVIGGGSAGNCQQFCPQNPNIFVPQK